MAGNGRRTPTSRSPRRARRLGAVGLTVALLVATMVVTSVGASAAVGHRAHSFAGFSAESSGGAITGQKPESKLWYHDGAWWGAMLSRSRSGAHTIHRLSNDAWVDTGVVIDTRPATKEDVLSVGSTLYIVSRGTSSIGDSQLRRFTYGSGTYRLDSGFPVTVPGRGAETTTLARDSTGRLWLTYTASKAVRVAHTTGSDTSWSSPFVVPVNDASTLTSDDISAVISFEDASGPAIGVMWSNQNTHRQHFAVHRDGAPPNQWSLETALSGNLEADDHINLKAHDGQVYAVVKTSAKSDSAALIRLLVRSKSGNWTPYPVARKDEKHTRPITMLQLDTTNRRIYVFMTRGTGTSARGIQYKSSPMTGIGFPTESTWFIQGDNSEPINDATSTKQNATAASGIVVLASDGNHYWWNRLGGGGATSPDPEPSPEPTSEPSPPPPEPTPPPPTGTVSFVSSASGVAAATTLVETATTMSAGPDAVYLASIASRSNVTVSSVTGLGLTWRQVATSCAGRSQAHLALWVASGSPTSSGVVQARFASSTKAAALVVHRYAGADVATPLTTPVVANTNGVGGACSGGTDNASYAVPTPHTATSGLAYGAVTMRSRSHTAGSGFVERAEVRGGSGGDTTGLATVDGALATSSPTTVTGTFGGTVDWAAITTTIRSP
jgi:hypothetical protein